MSATQAALRQRVETKTAAPWWRFGMVWLVFALPALVVLASLISAAIAWRHADTLVFDPPARPSQAATGAAAIAPGAGPLEPAQQARNHAATPKP